MQSVKSKNYGQGPRSYFQRLLGDVDRPFMPHSNAQQLLGYKGRSDLRPISANRIVSSQLHYQNPLGLWEESYGARSRANDPESPNVSKMGEGARTTISPQTAANSELVGSNNAESVEHKQAEIQLSSAIAQAEQSANEQVTLLSWLDKMQARQPTIAFEDTETEQKTPSADPLFNDINTDGRSSADHGEAKLEIPSADHFEQSVVKSHSSARQETQMPDVVSKKEPDNVDVQFTDINLPTGKSDLAQKPDKRDHQIENIRQAEPVFNKKPTSLSSYQQSVSNKAEITTPATKNHFVERSESPQSVVQLKPAFGKSDQAKIQKALSVTAIKRILVEEKAIQKTPKTQTDDAQRIAKSRPQLHQHVTVVNPPASQNSGNNAFWERSYMGRLGPRSYR